MKLKQPFFLVGFPRSGTTLLQVMISASDGLLIPPETKLLGLLIRRDKALPPFDTQAGLDARLELVRKGVCEHHEHTADWPALREELLAAPRDPIDWFDTLLAHLQHRAGCRRIGEKTPLHLLYADRLLQRFDDAKVITIIRDGRDASLSWRESLDETGSIAALALRWRHYMNLHDRLQQRWPADRYTSVRYEDLVTRPEQELRRLCGFLGEPFSDKMLQHHRRDDTGFAQRETHKLRTLEPVTNARVSRYVGVLTQGEVAAFQLIAGKHLKRHGYALQPAAPLRGAAEIARRLPGLARKRLAWRRAIHRNPQHIGPVER